MATYKDGKRVDKVSDRHYEILASHGNIDAIPQSRRSEFVAAPAPRQNRGGIFNSGYTSFRDMFDGGGPGRSGARFSSADTGAYDTNKDNYISEAEYSAASSGPNFSQTQGGIAALSNFVGARPRGSYARERALGQRGTNIGTSGIANYVAGGGMFGPLFGNGPTRMQQAMPNMEQGQQFTYQNLINSGMTHQQAMEFLGMPAAPPPRDYSPRPMLRPYGPPQIPATPRPFNMGGLLALRDYNMGMQMGMGQSV
jgi:hypothetical protein